MNLLGLNPIQYQNMLSTIPLWLIILLVVWKSKYSPYIFVNIHFLTSVNRISITTGIGIANNGLPLLQNTFPLLSLSLSHVTKVTNTKHRSASSTPTIAFYVSQNKLGENRVSNVNVKKNWCAFSKGGRKLKKI